MNQGLGLRPNITTTMYTGNSIHRVEPGITIDLNTLESPANVVVHASSEVGAVLEISSDTLGFDQYEIHIDEVPPIREICDEKPSVEVNVNIDTVEEEVTNEGIQEEPTQEEHKHNDDSFVGVIVMNSDGKILISKRIENPEKPFPGYFQPVGGHIDPGEGAVEAAIREVREEIGVDISATLELLFQYKAEDEEGNPGFGDVFIYIAKSDSFENMEPEKIDGDWFWIEPSELVNYHPLVPALIKLMDGGHLAEVDNPTPETDSSGG